MTVAYSSRTLRGGAGRLAAAAEAAHGAGFRAVHAAQPPSDVAAARAALERLAVALVAVSTEPVEDLDGVGPAIDRAATSAAALRRPLVLLEIRALVLPARSTPEAAVDGLVRRVHAAVRRHPGLALGIATPDGPGRLLGARETEWLLAELRDEPVSLAFDAAGALLVERSEGGTPVLATADRHGGRICALFVHGLEGGRGHARPEGDAPDWGTLRGLVPARAPRILDLAPTVPPAEVAEARRFVEHVFREGA